MGTLRLGREMPWERDCFWRILFSYACAIKHINLYIIYGIQDILYRKSLKVKNLTLSIVVIWNAFENFKGSFHSGPRGILPVRYSPSNSSFDSLEDWKYNAQNPMYHPFFIDDEAAWSSTWSKTKGDSLLVFGNGLRIWPPARRCDERRGGEEVEKTPTVSLSGVYWA